MAILVALSQVDSRNLRRSDRESQRRPAAGELSVPKFEFVIDGYRVQHLCSDRTRDRRHGERFRQLQS
jgi:hypothetical protein